MANSPIYIHAAVALGPGGVHGSPQRQALTRDPDTDLRALVKQVLGQPLRQGSHFIELAAIGARLCVGQLAESPPADSGVYFGTGLGQVRKTETLLDQILPPGTGFAAPFDFINASPNMGAFHAAAALGLSARNLTVAQDELSFERALELALSDLRAGALPAAFVGGADENFFPRADYLRRLPLREDQVMGEGSGWLYLDHNPRDARAELLGVELFHRNDGWLDSIGRHIASLAAAPLWLMPGFRLEDGDVAALRQYVPALGIRHYLPYSGAYPTAVAFGIADCLETADVATGLYFHLNTNSGGEAMLVSFRVP